MDRQGRIRHEEIDRYLRELGPEPDPVLLRMEEEAARDRVPILDRGTARLLAALVRFGRAGRILEVGTALGCSTLHMARALPEDGWIVSIDISEEMHERARAFFEEAGISDRVRLVTGAALDVLPGLVEEPDGLDLVFLDAVKEEYRAYLDLVLPAVRSGGMVVADNLLWKGQTAGMPLLDEGQRESTEALREFNAHLAAHPELEFVLIPVGDGAGVAVKR
jgi:caffeoyl-CoA O-methyltransferase